MLPQKPLNATKEKNQYVLNKEIIMANEKISELADLTTPANDDLLVGVDVSDTTMGPGGTNKKLTIEQLADFIELYTLINTEAELTQAITDGKTRFAILSPFSLTANLVFPEDNYLWIFCDVITAGNFSIDLNSHGDTFMSMSGVDHASCGIIYDPSSSHALFINDAGTNVLAFNNVAIINNSSNAGTPIAASASIQAIDASLSGGVGVNSGLRLNQTDSFALECSLSGNDIIIPGGGDNSSMIGNRIFLSGIQIAGTTDVRLEANRFNNCTIDIDVTSSQTVLVGNTADGTFALTDASTSTIRQGNTPNIGNDKEGYAGFFPTVGNTTYTIVTYMPQPGRIKGFAIEGGIATGTVSVEIDGVGVVGLEVLAVPTTPTYHAAVDSNTYNKGSVITITFDSTTLLVDFAYLLDVE
jgi:hypothetical protein